MQHGSYGVLLHSNRASCFAVVSTECTLALRGENDRETSSPYLCKVFYESPHNPPYSNEMCNFTTIVLIYFKNVIVKCIFQISYLDHITPLLQHSRPVRMCNNDVIMISTVHAQAATPSLIIGRKLSACTLWLWRYRTYECRLRKIRPFSVFYTHCMLETLFNGSRINWLSLYFCKYVKWSKRSSLLLLKLKYRNRSGQSIFIKQNSLIDRFRGQYNNAYMPVSGLKRLYCSKYIRRRPKAK